MDRRPWSKRWDAEYLADSKLNRLTPAERGVVEIMWALLRCQTDEPGVFVEDGSILDVPGIAQAVKPHCTGGGVRIAFVVKWVSIALQVGPFEQREDGAWYSSRIVKEAQEAEESSAYGKKGSDKRWGAEDTTIMRRKKKTPIAPPMPDPIATPIARAEEDEEEEAEQPGARACDYSGKDESQEPTATPEEPKLTGADRAIQGTEEISSLVLATNDRKRIERAVHGKTDADIDLALERIASAYELGTVRSLVAFAERVFRDTVAAPSPRDRSDDAAITTTKVVCTTLGLSWSNCHVQVLRAVKENPTRASSAMHTTFEDVKSKIISDSQTSILERFLMRIEDATLAPAFAPG